MKAEAGPLSQAATIVLKPEVCSRGLGYTEGYGGSGQTGGRAETRLGNPESEARQTVLDSEADAARDRRVLRRRRFGVSGVGRASRAGRKCRAPSRPIRLPFPSPTRATPRRSRASAVSSTNTSRPASSKSGLRKKRSNRCFHCKDELFTRLEIVARERGIEHIAYGVNVDDLGDYRPGQHAAKLDQANAPLVDAGLTKAEMRECRASPGCPPGTVPRPPA